MKKKILIFFIIIVIIILAICLYLFKFKSSENTISLLTMTNYKNIISSYNYTVTDTEEKEENIIESCNAKSSDLNVISAYINCETEDAAVEQFDSLQKKLLEVVTDSLNATDLNTGYISSENPIKYYIQTDSFYCMLIRNSTEVIYILGPVSEVNSFFTILNDFGF